MYVSARVVVLLFAWASIPFPDVVCSYMGVSKWTLHSIWQAFHDLTREADINALFTADHHLVQYRMITYETQCYVARFNFLSNQHPNYHLDIPTPLTINARFQNYKYATVQRAGRFGNLSCHLPSTSGTFASTVSLRNPCPLAAVLSRSSFAV